MFDDIRDSGNSKPEYRKFSKLNREENSDCQKARLWGDLFRDMLTRCKVFSRWGVGENILGEQEEGVIWDILVRVRSRPRVTIYSLKPAEVDLPNRVFQPCTYNVV